MKRLLHVLLFAAALGVAGCGNGTSEKTTAPDRKADRDPNDEVSQNGKKWGGWRWHGKRDDCFFVHENKCYDNQKNACKAAGCSLSKCKIEGGGPAKVVCSKK